MSELGYGIAHVDELEPLAVEGHDFSWRLVRRRFGITAFGANVYGADAGQNVIEPHEERGGHEELYVVLRGRAAFTVGDDELEAGPGTLLFVQPETHRRADALEDGTAVLVIGAQPGVAFEPSAWEGVRAAFCYAQAGDVERGRAALEEALAAGADTWQAQYNAACFEARFGDPEAALAHYRRAEELDAEQVRRIAPDDPDLDPIRSAIAGEPQAGGAGA